MPDLRAGYKAVPAPFRATRLPYRADIDGLRAIAVLSVVAFHAFPSWLPGGFIGVDIFFVISGFLISSIILEGVAQGTFTFLDFYGRRIKRLFPALALMLAATYAFGWFVLLPEEFQNLGRHIAGGAAFVSNFVLWNESGYFDKAAEAKPLLHLWSLGIEEQFYLVWPLLIWLASKRNHLLGITLAIALASFAFNIFGLYYPGIGHDAIATFYSPHTRFWELMVGAVLAFRPTWLDAGRLARPLGKDARLLRHGPSLLGALLIVLGLATITKGAYFPGWWALLPTAGAALIISAGPQAWLNRAILSRPILVWLGLISFPLYLWHWPLLVLGPFAAPDLSANAVRLAAILLAIMLAWMTYSLAEMPTRRSGHGATKAIALAATMVTIGFVGYHAYDRKGMPGRFPQIAFLQIENNDYTQWRKGCYVGGSDNHDAFLSCDDTVVPTKKTILLWGDSHAAHLY